MVVLECCLLFSIGTGRKQQLSCSDSRKKEINALLRRSPSQFKSLSLIINYLMKDAEKQL